MNKKELDTFINRYSLNGLIEAVKLHSNNGEISVAGADGEKNLIAMITTTKVDLEDGVFSIGDTSSLKALIGVLDGDIKVSVKDTNGKPYAFLINDASTKITFGLAMENIIPVVPKPKVFPPTPLKVKITKDVITRYLKACSAMSSDATQFAILTDGTTVELVLNYAANQNTNRIAIELEVIEGFAADPTYYSMSHLANVFSANKDCDGRLEIAPQANQGFINILFEVPDYTINYYLMGGAAK